MMIINGDYSWDSDDDDDDGDDDDGGPGGIHPKYLRNEYL